MRLFALFLLCLATAGSDLAVADAVRQPSYAELQAAGLPVAPGRGRINGHDLPVSVLTGASVQDLVAEIKNALRGQYNVAALSDGETVTLVIADLQSSMCPRCRPPHAADLDEIMANSYAFTLIALPGGKAMGFGSGGLVSAVQAGPNVYEGPARELLAGQLEVEAQSSFAFGRTHTFTTLARLPGTPAARQAKVGDALQASGYAPVPGGDAGEGSGQSGSFSCWRRGASVVSVATPEDTPPNSQTNAKNEVVIHEVVAP